MKSMEAPLSEDKKRILNILRKNARQKRSEIASMTNMPASTVADAMRSMESSLSMRYSTLVDYRKTGHTTRAMFVIKLKDPGLIDFLSDHEGINTILRTKDDCAGANTFFIEAIFRGMKEMADFTEELSLAGIKILKEFHVIEDLKREEFVI